jgi:hypothetical protein
MLLATAFHAFQPASYHLVGQQFGDVRAIAFCDQTLVSLVRFGE